MAQQTQNYYLGIDLGTTNSVISWGNVSRREQVLDPQVIDFPMMIEGRAMRNGTLLPSYVYFSEDGPIVGEYAKTMIGRQTDRVVKSIKSYMGTPETFPFDDENYEPAEISAIILKQLAAGAKNVDIDVKQVVITVPASFDSDQRSATIQAGELAGFEVTLFDEPRAALYDFANRQEKGEIPRTSIDFDTPKLVLVFDLGGGTLDVSLHRVSYPQGEHELSIEDIAIGRYTLLGGDDFDKLLADHFLEAYSSRLPRNLSSYDLNLLESEFQVYAELAKIDLSNRAFQKGQLGIDNWEPDDIETAVIQAPSVNPSQLFQYNLTLKEYEQVVEPLLAIDLSLDSVDEPDADPFENNIIYPILDVLRKAKKKLQLDTHPEINAVLLNGGMTRLHSIQKRLERFFGFSPITAGEPDKAVARGASVYHYRLEHGYKPTRILNDTIGIELAGDRVKPLVEAGTVLPSPPQAIEELTVSEGSSSLRLPFYLGSGLDTKLPNRKILERHVQLGRPFLENERIILQVRVDERGILDVKGWRETHPDQKFTVTVDSEKPETLEADSVTEIKEQVEETVDVDKPQKFEAPTLDVQSEIQLLKKKCFQYMNTYDNGRKRVIMDQLTQQRSRITQASNASELIEPLIEGIDAIEDRDANNCFNGRAMILLGDLASFCSDDSQLIDIHGAGMMLSEPVALPYKHPTVINTVVRYAIEAIGKTRLPSAEAHLLSVLNQDSIHTIRLSAIYSIGKCCQSVNASQHLAGLITSRTDADRIAVNWALGKIGSREKETPLPINALSQIVSDIIVQLRCEEHNQALQHGIYALGEICDRRNREVDIVTDDVAEEAKRVLDTFSSSLLGSSLSELVSLKEQQILQNLAQMAIQMIEGAQLTSEQTASLLTIRDANY